MMLPPPSSTAIPWDALTILYPLVVAVALAIMPPRHRPPFATWSALGLLLMTGALLATIIAHGPLHHFPGGWAAPLGIALNADALAALLLALTGGVGAAITIYATGYWPASAPPSNGHAAADGHAPAPSPPAFWPLWFFAWSALNAMFLSADLFNVYVAMELLTLTAVALVSLSGAPLALGAALRYLMLALTASLLYLVGVGLLYARYGRLDFSGIALLLEADPATLAAFGLILTGLAAKTALVPLHVWLPPAHAMAPAPVSAALSALVIKGPFIVLLRLVFGLVPAAAVIPITALLGGLGAIAVLWGSLQALCQPRLKQIVAYSTVAQVGYLFMALPLAAYAETPAEATLVWSACIYHLLSHACAKAALFLAAGSVIHAVGHDRLDALRVIGARRPMLLTALALAALGIMGLPPSGGFIAKWILLQAAITQGHWLWVAILISGGLLAAAYLFRPLCQAFLPPETPVEPQPPTPRMDAMALLLAVLALVLGLTAPPILNALAAASPFGPGGLP